MLYKIFGLSDLKFYAIELYEFILHNSGGIIWSIKYGFVSSQLT